MKQLTIPSNSVDVTALLKRSLDIYKAAFAWVHEHVGQHVRKGYHSTVRIYESEELAWDRSFGIGWHLDIKRDHDLGTTYLLTIYNDYKLIEFKLTWL